MKTKMRVLKNEPSTTTIISIPPSAASGVLKALHGNKVPTDYMGLDQSGRILMEVTLYETHGDLLKEINEHIEQCEEISEAITKSVNELVQKRNEEIDKLLSEHRKKWKKREGEREKRNSTTETVKDGNKQE